MQCPPNDIKHKEYMTSVERVKLLTAQYTVNKGHSRANKIMSKSQKLPPMKERLKLLKILHKGVLKKGTFYETPVKRYFYTHKNNLA